MASSESLHGPARQGAQSGAPLESDYKRRILVASLKGGELRPSGSFAMHGELRQFCLPGLKLPQLGPIGMPLLPTVAQEMSKLCSPAPFGRGEATIIDHNVRNCLQMEPKDFSLTNSDWQDQVQELANGTVKVGLGLRKEVEVVPELYKLLLYETGSFFTSHSDSEKVEGMFATLVIVLPSAHAGGELIVRHAGLETTFDSGSGSLDNIQFAAFYADCRHELRPVREGYRLALIYNLVAVGKAEVSTPITNKTPGHEVLDAVETWSKLPRASEKLVIPLAYRYSKHALSVKNLKGEDVESVDVILQAIKHQRGRQLHFWLGTLRRYESRWDDEEKSLLKLEFKLLDVIPGDQESDEVAFKELPVEGGEILPLEVMCDFSKWDEEEEEEMGNDGIATNRWYHHAAIVLWPRCHHWTHLIHNPRMAIEEAQAVAKVVQGASTALSAEHKDLDLALRTLCCHGSVLNLHEARVLAGLVMEYGTLAMAKALIGTVTPDTSAVVWWLLGNHFGWEALTGDVISALELHCRKPGLEAGLMALLSLAAEAGMGATQLLGGEPRLTASDGAGAEVGAGELSPSGKRLKLAPEGDVQVEGDARAQVSKQEDRVGEGAAGLEGQPEGLRGTAAAAAAAEPVITVASGLAERIFQQPREEVKESRIYSSDLPFTLASTAAMGAFLRVLEVFGVDLWRRSTLLMMADTVMCHLWNVPMLLAHLVKVAGQQGCTAAGTATGASVRKRSKECFFAGHTLSRVLVRHLTSKGLFQRLADGNWPSTQKENTQLAAFVSDCLGLAAPFLPDLAIERLISFILNADLPLDAVLLPALRSVHATLGESAPQTPWFILFAAKYRTSFEVALRTAARPVQPRDWALDNSSVDCDCRHCQDLSSFCKASDASERKSYMFVRSIEGHVRASVERNGLLVSVQVEDGLLCVRKAGSRGVLDAKEWTEYRGAGVRHARLMLILPEVTDILAEFWVKFAQSFRGLPLK